MQFMMERRRIRYIGNSKRRYGGKNALMAVNEKYAKCGFAVNLMAFAYKRHLGIDARLRYLLAAFYAAYIVSINRTIVFVAQPVPRQYRTFATINPETISALFRFQQADFPRLMFNLPIPAEFKLNNGSWVNGCYR
jgi:hypothetical protein